MSLKLEAIFGEGLTCWPSLWRPSRCFFPPSTSPRLFLPTFPKLQVSLSFLSLSILFQDLVWFSFCHSSCLYLRQFCFFSYTELLTAPSFLQLLSLLPFVLLCWICFSLLLLPLACLVFFCSSVLLLFIRHQTGLCFTFLEMDRQRDRHKERERLGNWELTYIYMYKYLLFNELSEEHNNTVQ